MDFVDAAPELRVVDGQRFVPNHHDLGVALFFPEPAFDQQPLRLDRLRLHRELAPTLRGPRFDQLEPQYRRYDGRGNPDPDDQPGPPGRLSGELFAGNCHRSNVLDSRHSSLEVIRPRQADVSVFEGEIWISRSRLPSAPLNFIYTLARPGFPSEWAPQNADFVAPPRKAHARRRGAVKSQP